MMKKLRPSQMEHASAQYRGFMYLVWEKRFSDSKNSVVPTDLAKIVWLEHMDDELSYDNFCQELFGEYLQFRESSKKDESMEYQQAISFI
ncbi:MAG: hypothetical protein LR008_01170 [Candidatus Pacebacteria bacterium]|nr:hypothetical protein [Candidatus Paceibacterota bacterium]